MISSSRFKQSWRPFSKPRVVSLDAWRCSHGDGFEALLKNNTFNRGSPLYTLAQSILIGGIAKREVTSKTLASGLTPAITQHPLLPLDRTVRHSGCSGKCESLWMPCNAEREICEGCQTASLCPFVWVVFFMLLWGSQSSNILICNRDVYPYPCFF